MMLTSTYFLPPQQQYYSAYTPPRPSPLSERSTNVAPRLFDFSMAAQGNEKKSPMPQRAFKPNPLIQTRDAATKRRREMFFKRVQNSREDKKWESRGEKIQHLDFISERKRWEAEKARQAPAEHDIFDEELFEASLPTDLPVYASKQEEDMTEAEYIAAQEEHELQQLIATMEQEHEQDDASSQHFGSDDEDYDALFMECVSNLDQQYHQQQHQGTSSFSENADAMDMEMTDA